MFKKKLHADFLLNSLFDYILSFFKLEIDSTEAIALYDYKGRSDKEITFKKGDKLKIKGQLSADWWLGAIEFASNTNGNQNILLKYGYIPDKYIALRNKSRFKIFLKLIV